MRGDQSEAAGWLSEKELRKGRQTYFGTGQINDTMAGKLRTIGTESGCWCNNAVYRINFNSHQTMAHMHGCTPTPTPPPHTPRRLTVQFVKLIHGMP